MINTMRKPILLATFASLAVVLGVAFADEESDRKDLISKIEGRLDYAAGELSGLESDSDAGDVNDALGYMREVEGYVNDLSRVKGSDSTANNMVSYYPGYIRDFRSAAEELKRLKEKQRLAEQTITTCKAFDQEMTQRAQNAKDEPRAADELREFSKSVGRKGEDVINEAQRKLSEVERHRDDVKRFSASDGKWSNVRSYMHSSADAIARIHKDDYDKAKRECEEVIKRERHREVEKALGRLANSSTGRAELRKKIDELLITLSDRVKDVQSQSGSGYVNGAVEISKEIESQLERLRGAQGDDDEAKRIASTWPQWTRDLRAALEALREMKNVQNRADEGAGKCEAAEKALGEKIKGYLDEREKYPEASRELPEEADRIGSPIKAGIDKAREVDRQMSDWVGKAKNFGQSDGNWSRVTSNLKDSSDRVHSHWKEKYGAMVKSCEHLVLGKDHPEVKKALETIATRLGTAGDDFTAAKAKAEAFGAGYNALRKLTPQETQNLVTAICEAEEADRKSVMSDVASRTATTIAAKHDDLQALYSSAIKALDAVLADKSLKAKHSETRTLRAEVEQRWTTIGKMTQSLRAKNHPAVKFLAEEGDRQHENRQKDSSHCTVYEVGIGSNIIDCARASDCTVVELKPDNARSITKGTRQARSAYETLNRSADERAKLAAKNSAFGQCKAYDWEVWCYKLCPDIDTETNEMKSISATWRKCAP